MTTYYIVWWEYSDYEDGAYDEDGMDGYAVDHYQPFQSFEEAEQALLDYLAFDTGAHILTMGE